MHGGGSRGGPVASFTRTTSRHSSLQRQAPCAYPQSYAVGTDQCAIFGIVATVIDCFSLLVTTYHRLFFTTCHYLSSTVTYHCLAPVPAEHRLVLFAGKSEHHLDLVNTYFTPTNFYVHGPQVKVHPGARMRLPFPFPSRTYAHTHTHGQNQL